MKFRLRPEVKVLRGLTEAEVKQVAEEMGWACEKMQFEDKVLYFLQKSGCGFSIEIEDGRVNSNYLLNPEGMLNLGRLETGAEKIEGVPQVKAISGHLHPVLMVGDYGVYNWAGFYELEPFEGVVKLKARSVVFTRKFISSDCVGTGPDTVPLSVWKKYTVKGAKQVSYLHKKLKFNCMCIKDPSEAVWLLMQTLGEIQQNSEGFYEIMDTGEMTMLSPGDLVVYNKDILLHINTYQLAGFETV